MPLPLIVPHLPPALEQPVLATEVSLPLVERVTERSHPPRERDGVEAEAVVLTTEPSSPGSSEWRDGSVPPAQTGPLPPWPSAVPPGESLEPESLEAEATEDEPADQKLDDGTISYTAESLILRADRQEYEPQRQIIFATGDVLVQVGDSQLASDRLWVNLNHRQLRAEGDVLFNRNQQIIEADSATYNLLQGVGSVTDARGALQLSSLGADFASPFANDQAVDPNSPIDYRFQRIGTISEVTSTGGVSLVTDAQQVLFGAEQQDLRRLRFESSRIDFDANGWFGRDVRITNDPFSPPELELRSDQVSLIPLNENQDEVCFDNPRFVFDQGLSIPVLRRCYTLERGQLPENAFNPLPTGIGYDARDRGGLFIERELRLPMGSPWRASIVPQFYISRGLDNAETLLDPANFGLVARLSGPIGPRTTATALVSLPGLDLSNFTERLRASFRAQHLIGTHRLNLEYTYRDRLFNGSLGFQDVQSSTGVLLESPVIPLGNTQINLSYQVSGQYVTANTDQLDLLDPGQTLGLTSLWRGQASADLSRGFVLWQGQPEPSTPTAGLRYSPRPIVPSLGLAVGIRGTATYYSSNDRQSALEARLSLAGQFGHLIRDFLDYTQFNIGFSTNLLGGEPSPFLFDRVVDQKILSGGLLQQIYGPILAGFQTSLNIDNGNEIDTSFVLEYRRRAYGLTLRYSPIQETGFLGFRLSNFNWSGRPSRFDSEESSADSQIRLNGITPGPEGWSP